MAPIPLVICGRNPNIATTVRDQLLPEYEVIHIILSVPAGTADLPLLLSSQTPPNASSNLGSRNYSTPPVVVALGGGFSDEMFEQIKEACRDASGTVWLRADTSQMGPPKPEEAEKYGILTAERLRKRLGELKIGGDDGVGEGVFWF